MAPGKFNMDVAVAIASKRTAEPMPPASTLPSKVPKADDVTFIEPPPKRAASTQRLPTWAPVLVCIYKITDEASDIWNAYEGNDGIQLWQVQVGHEARPSITFGLIESFNDFLRNAHATNESMPTTLIDLQVAGIKLVTTDAADPDGVGYINWRACTCVKIKFPLGVHINLVLVGVQLSGCRSVYFWWF